MTQDIPKKDDHEHDQSTWTDDALLRHVQEDHDLTDKPWLLNEGNRIALVEAHQRAHSTDAIRVDWKR